MSTDHIYFNAFNQTSQIGSVRFRKLLNFFPDLGTAWKASSLELRQAGLEDQVIEKIFDVRSKIDPETEYAKLINQKISLISFTDENYPSLLKEIPNPPGLLYVRGLIQEVDQIAIAVVGSRKFTSYGKQVVEHLVTELANMRITIISGLALGIDALAHHAAIQAGGRTLAILPSGIDAIYPAANRHLAEKILAQERGALISELPLGTPPYKHNFPNRNRIIAGLTLGTVVIEAASESGALITARHALEQNREVFAVPGSIFSESSMGPNNLLKMGAKLVSSASDILEELNLSVPETKTIPRQLKADNPEEEKILAALNFEPQHFDELAQASELPASVVAATLTIMEMKGKVRNLGANQYVKAR